VRGTAGQPGVDEHTRERVRSTIGLVGGYWRPLAAVARLLEELGELAELLALGGGHGESRSSNAAPRPFGDERLSYELADLWIITTALSDQFLGVVAEPGSYNPSRSGDGAGRASHESGGVARDSLGDLIAAAGPIARIVNYYDGPKTPRSFDGWISLSDAVVQFHRSLASVAHAYGVDLAEAVDAKLDAIPTIDSGRFGEGVHDPSTARSVERFRALPFAGVEPDDAQAGCDSLPDLDIQRARLWGSPEYSPETRSQVVADLISFTKAAPWERLDAYLIHGPPCSSIALRQDWLRRVLSEVSTCDPSRGEQAFTGLVESPFAFNGLRLLVSTFDVPLETGTFALLRVEHAPDGPLAQ
jgi:hypothetical protein